MKPEAQSPPVGPSGTAATDRTDGFVMFVLIGQQLLGSLTFPIAKYGLAEVEPFTFAFFRFVLSALVLVAIVRFRTWRIPIEKPDRWKIAGLGCLVVLGNQVTYLWGQSMTAAGHGALLFAATPIFIFLMALVHLGEKFKWRRAIGVVIGIAGVAIVMGAGAIKIGTEYLIGDAIILFAVLVWAYYTVWGKPLARKYGAMRVTAYSLASGTLLYFPFGLVRAIQFDYDGVSTGAWLSVAYVAIGTSVFGYMLWYWVLKYFEASRVAVFQNVQPIFASMVAYVFLNEPLGWSFVIGGAVVLVGVITTEV